MIRSVTIRPNSSHQDFPPNLPDKWPSPAKDTPATKVARQDERTRQMKNWQSAASYQSCHLAENRDYRQAVQEIRHVLGQDGCPYGTTFPWMDSVCPPSAEAESLTLDVTTTHEPWKQLPGDKRGPTRYAIVTMQVT